MELIKNTTIINLIRFTPAFIILIIACVISLIFFSEYKSDLQKTQTTFKTTLIEQNKEILKSNIFTIENYINQEFNQTEQNLKDTLTQEIETVHQIMTSIYNNYKDTKSREEIILMMKNSIRDLRFNNGRGYFFINQTNGISVLHPIFPKREGTDISKQKDITGIARFQLLKDGVLNKDGFTSFYFFHPLDKSKQREKIIFGKLFEPYQLIIGTGEYKDDFEKSFKNKVLSYLQTLEYKNNEYAFAFDYSGNPLISYKNMHQGQNIFTNKNVIFKNPKALKDFINSSKKSTFIEYSIKNKGYIKYEKISFITKIEPFKMIIGTGFNIDRINEIIKTNEEKLNNEHKNRLNRLIIITLIVTALLMILLYFITKLLEKKLNNYQNKLLQKELQIFESSKLAAMGAMIGNIIHQWKQPLSMITIITTSTQFKLQAEKSELAQTIDKDLDKINNTVDRLVSITNTFKNFLKEKKEVKKIILQDKIDEVLIISGTMLHDKNIEVIKEYNTHNAIELTTIASEFIEVIINIISNAIDAIEDNNIEDGWIKITVSQQTDKVSINIEDNAGGVPDKTIPYIFDEYYTTKSDDKGTGLGLYMSHKIITESLGGSLSLENTNNGAQFSIQLPTNQ